MKWMKKMIWMKMMIWMIWMKMMKWMKIFKDPEGPGLTSKPPNPMTD